MVPRSRLSSHGRVVKSWRPENSSGEGNESPTMRAGIRITLALCAVAISFTPAWPWGARLSRPHRCPIDRRSADCWHPLLADETISSAMLGRADRRLDLEPFAEKARIGLRDSIHVIQPRETCGAVHLEIIRYNAPAIRPADEHRSLKPRRLNHCLDLVGPARRFFVFLGLQRLVGITVAA
jgi:hypothetical protein